MRIHKLLFIILIIHSFSVYAQVNGEIIENSQDTGGNGYSVIKLWGTYYEMGYAYGYLLADDIEDRVQGTKSLAGGSYSSLKTRISATFFPDDMIQEINGMIDGIKAQNPSSTVDSGDIMMLNTYGDWEYAGLCRSHSCWGSYVSSPVKTLSTRRLDLSNDFYFQGGSAHHIITVYDTDNKWINFATPGVIIAVTAINEEGTMVSIHDSPSSSGGSPYGNNLLTRCVATRYMMTMPHPEPLSEQADAVFDALKDYTPWTGSYLNYYAPENGAVITCSNSQGFYAINKGSQSYFNGDVVMTTNDDTDGSYTPSGGEQIAALYQTPGPKTLQQHWNVLDSTGGIQGLQLVSVAVRDEADMTIWFRGKLRYSTTPRLEYEWSELFGSCGDGNCENSENCSTCEADCGACGPECGDGACDATESCSICEADCGECSIDCVHDADKEPCDGCVDTLELSDYLDAWKTGDVDMTNLMTVIGIWKSGCI